MPDIPSPKLEDVRRLMFEQLSALRNAEPGEVLAQELKRSRGVSELSQTIIDSARVEVSYLQASGESGSPFLDYSDVEPKLTRLPGDGNGIVSITRHKLR